jgi:hypothetical protein
MSAAFRLAEAREGGQIIAMSTPRGEYEPPRRDAGSKAADIGKHDRATDSSFAAKFALLALVTLSVAFDNEPTAGWRRAAFQALRLFRSRHCHTHSQIGSR